MLGDHGMSDAGSHGGASVSEVMTPIVALSPAFVASENHTLTRKKLELVNQQVSLLKVLLLNKKLFMYKLCLNLCQELGIPPKPL